MKKKTREFHTLPSQDNHVWLWLSLVVVAPHVCIFANHLLVPTSMARWRYDVILSRVPPVRIGLAKLRYASPACFFSPEKWISFLTTHRRKNKRTILLLGKCFLYFWLSITLYYILAYHVATFPFLVENVPDFAELNVYVTWSHARSRHTTNVRK